ncbi:MAG: HAMP domain-containing protein [bacterium]|nr:HAMP domain-containing protein [bacterium]
MRKYSLYSIIFGIFATSFLVASVLIYFSITSHQQDLFKAGIEEKIKLAEAIKETVGSPSWFYRMSLLKDSEKGLIAGLAKFKDVRFIRIVKSTGEIHQSTLEGEIGKKLKDIDIANVIKSEKSLIRDETLRGEDIKALIYPSYENQAIWIGFSFRETQILMSRLLWRYLLVVLLALFLGTGAMVVILRSVVDPIREITASCEDVRRGNLDVRIKTSPRTEIGDLAETFNEMLGDLKDSRQKLEEAKEVLEVRVAARTRELQDLANSLEEQVKARTEDLQGKMKELERFNRLAVDRELKMVDLKKEIKKLEEELGQPFEASRDNNSQDKA